jgi:uncharacterized membrane protein YciS (DUF1049 family)
MIDAFWNVMSSWGPIIGVGLIIGWLACVVLTFWLLLREYNDLSQHRRNLERYNNMARYRVDPGDRT